VLLADGHRQPDTHAGADVMKLFLELNREGLTIVLVTHDAVVAALTRRTIHVSDGRILEAAV
jgi:ABC-type lipoprotein export system ATPase subunit